MDVYGRSVNGKRGISRNKYATHNSRVLCSSEAELDQIVKASHRRVRQLDALRFTATFDSVLKTSVRSDTAISWIGNSYGITWVAVHSINDSICVVTRRHGLDMARLGEFDKTFTKNDLMSALTSAIVSEVEGLAYDDAMNGMILQKPFGVVSVLPVVKKSDEKAGQLAASFEYDKEKAINFLGGKTKVSDVITLDDVIKIAISAFKHLSCQELGANDYWVTTFTGKGKAEHLLVPTIEKHLVDINSRSGNGANGNSEDGANGQHILARRFTKCCFYDMKVHKTCVWSGVACSWNEKSTYYGISWVAVQSMDSSICVVARQDDLDMTPVCAFHKTLHKPQVMHCLTEHIASEVAGIPCDHDFQDRFGLIIKKSFGVVSVFPAAKMSGKDETGQMTSSVGYDEEKAIIYLIKNISKSEVITPNDAIKTAISAYKQMCLQEFKAEDLFVTVFRGHGQAEHLLVPTIEEHLLYINSGFSYNENVITI